jgi:hypothetical protein
MQIWTQGFEKEETMDDLLYWMAFNSLPDVFEFNDTTIPEVFDGKMPTIFIFLDSLDHPIYEEFKEAALSMKG